MKKISYFIGILCLLLLFTSCKEEKKVTAKYHSGEEIISEKYDPDTLLTENMFPNMEADEGYQIENWYLDQDYETLVVFPYQLKEDTHFYLRWVPVTAQNKVTIYLHNDDQTEEKSIDINTTLNEPQAEKIGYKFKGWSTDKNTYTPFDFSSVVTKDTHLYAFYDINQYKVTFYNGEDIYEYKLYDFNQTVTIPQNPFIEGSTFKGWSTDKDTYAEYNFTNTISKDINLYAFYDNNQYKVTFYNGEDIYEYKLYDFNQTIAKPSNPSKDGYTFKGWSTDKDTYTEYLFTNTISEDVNLYAFYDINQYKVTFYNDEDIYEYKLYDFNQTIAKPSNPSKDGYTFKGWSTDKDTYAEYNFTNTISEDVNLYAFYDINQYEIKYYVNDTLYKTQKIDYNTTTTAPENPTDATLVFEGWYLEKDFKTKFNFDNPIKNSFNLYANMLDPSIPTVKVELIIDDKTTSQTIELNSTLKQPENPSKDGYTFKGWSTDKDTYTAYDFTKPVEKPLTLYAYFDINTYTITFDVDGTVTTASVDYLATITKPTDPAKTGYTFKGWSTNKDMYIEYDFAKPVQSEFTLYAFFDINTYTITFDVDGNTTTSSVDYLGVVTKPSNPSKTGYTFKGWSTNKNSYNEYDFTKPVQSEFTLYAFFDIHTYTITFDVDGTVTTASVDYLSTVTKPANPSKTGYTFKGWSTNKNSYNEYDFTKLVQAGLTLYAFFDINSYTVSFDVDGTITTASVDYLGTVTKPSNPSKDGHTFKGWYYNNQEFNFSTPITTNITLVAKFDKIVQYTVTFKNGSTITTQKVDEGKLVTKPEDPIKDGYSFIGWYEDGVKFDFTTAIESNITLEAHFEESVLNITSSSGYTEGLYIEFDKLNGLSLSDYTISYKLSSNTSFKNVDSQLIREKGNTIRCDIVGLPAGDYDVKINAGTKSMSKSFTVTADDRSGYAHFGNTTGVGAYNDDGTLKSNAVVVYVSDETKNTVTAQIGGKTYTGLVAIIKACTKSTYALDIRILGEIQTTQWNFKEHGTGNTSARQENLENTFNYVNDTSNWDEKSSSNYSKLNAEDIISKGINSMSNDIAKGITKLEGLTNQVLRNKKADSKTGAYEYDSYYNMLDVAGAYNITIEGIGTDAAIFQWGFAFKKCNSIEIKNLRFYNYTEDAVGFEGASNSDINYGYYWVHNCTFDLGVNNWDVCYENDKKDGDGSTDVKYCHNVTISYVQYNKTHKTNLIGSSDSALQYNITLHHNYYNNCGSRLPLVRQTNIHMYNNYYYKSSSYSNSIRANCYALVENCYYEAGQNPYETQSNGAIKAYNNIYASDVKLSSSTYKKGNTVNSRTETVSNTCKPDGSTDYSNFDMNPTLFYYDATNQVSKVKDMLAPGDVPAHCKTYSGTLKANAKGLPDSSGGGSTVTPEPDPITPTGNKVVLSFNDFATASITATTTVNGITILPKSGKTAEIKALKSSQTIADTSVSKYIAFGGAGSFNDLSAKFTTTKKANITVYYDSSTAGRYAQLCSDSTSTKAETATVSGQVVSYTFTNQEAGTYSVCSYNSSLNIYLIVIEYVE